MVTWLATSMDYRPLGLLLPFLPSLAIGKLGISKKVLQVPEVKRLEERTVHKAEVI